MSYVVIFILIVPLAVYMWSGYKNQLERHNRKTYDLENFSQKVKAELEESKKRREAKERSQKKNKDIA